MDSDGNEKLIVVRVEGRRPHGPDHCVGHWLTPRWLSRGGFPEPRMGGRCGSAFRLLGRRDLVASVIRTGKRGKGD